MKNLVPILMLELYERIAVDTKKQFHYDKHTNLWAWTAKGFYPTGDDFEFESRYDALVNSVEPYTNHN
jgi:hypothetical protein|tara:strand:+ start:5113 stop:5316 length:204 start_codon:yes stop_codon:yes gene_type:complete